MVSTPRRLRSASHRSRPAPNVRAGLGRLLLLAAILAGMLATVGCIDIYAPRGAVSGLEASQDENDRIVLSWESVPFSGGYAVYRSRTGSDGFEAIGYTGEESFVDTEVAPEVVYWYRVGALPYSGEAQREILSQPVSGTSTHEFGWTTSVRANGAAAAALTLDPAHPGDEASPGVAYAASAGAGESSIAVDRFDGRAWSDFGEETGAVDTSTPGGIALAARDGTVYLAYADRTQGGALTVLSRSDEEDASWAPAGSRGFGTVPTGTIDLVVTGSGIPVVSVRIGTESASAGPDPGVEVYRFVDGAWTQDSLPVPTSQKPAHHALLLDENALYLAFEDISTDPSTIRLYRHSTTSGWSELTQLSRTAGGRAIAGGFAAAAANDRLVVALVTDGGIVDVQAFDTVGEIWTDLGFEDQADTETGALAVAGEGGRDYLFYRHADTLAGVVATRSDDRWSTIPVSQDVEETEETLTSTLGVSTLLLETRDNRVYAGYIDEGGGFGGGQAFSVSIYR